MRALADAEERAAEAEREYQTLEASGLSVERATHEDGEVTTGRRGERGGETEEETQRRAVAVRETAEKAEMESRVVDEEAQRRTAAAREIAEQAEAEARDLEDRRDRIRAAIEKLEEEAQRAR